MGKAFFGCQLLLRTAADTRKQGRDLPRCSISKRFRYLTRLINARVARSDRASRQPCDQCVALNRRGERLCSLCEFPSQEAKQAVVTLVLCSEQNPTDCIRLVSIGDDVYAFGRQSAQIGGCTNAGILSASAFGTARFPCLLPLGQTLVAERFIRRRIDGEQLSANRTKGRKDEIEQ